MNLQSPHLTLVLEPATDDDFMETCLRSVALDGHPMTREEFISLYLGHNPTLDQFETHN